MDSEAVYQQLREQIVSGVYRAGDRLPEVSLSTAFAVSRTPVREALRRLESDGLVSGSGRGVKVTEMTADTVQQAHGVRAALETVAAELAADRQRAGRLAPAALADLEGKAAHLETVTAAGDLERAVDLNREFHLGIAELAGNQIALEMLDRLWTQLTVSTRASLVTAGRPDAVAAEHRALLAAITRGDSARAGRIAADHALATARDRESPQQARNAAMPKTHSYETTVTWTGNSGSGTSGYRDYERSHEISADGKPTIPGSSDPAFRGDPARWSPEELLVTSLSQCHMLWFLHVCAAAGVVVTSYCDRPVGTMIETADGGGHFDKVILRPEVRFAEPGQAARAAALHERAHELCFVANSVNFPVRCEPASAR